MLRNSIIESTKALNSAAEKAEQEVLKFFQEIKGIISERENALKREIFERYKKEEEVIKNYDHNISIFFNDIEQFNQNYEQSLREDDISLLSSSIERLHLIKRITTEPEDLKLNISFEKLDKAEEVQLLCNMLSQLDNSISLSLQSHQNSHKDIMNILLDKPEATPKNKEPKE